jgi:hypothetical protein
LTEFHITATRESPGTTSFKICRRFDSTSGALTAGLKDIDPIYFYYNRTFIWTQDEIHSLEDESSTIWSCVHLDRQQFVSFLQELGVSVQQNLDPRAPQDLDAEVPADLSNLETSGTGLAGRGTSIQYIIPRAKKRLDAGLSEHQNGICEASGQGLCQGCT